MNAFEIPGVMMRRCALVMFVIATSVLGAIGFAGDIYKSVDSKGRVTYSDQPSPSAQRVVLPPTPKSSADERDRISRQMEAFSQADAQRASRAEAEQKEKALKKAMEDRRKEMCKRTRDRYLNFSEARRPYRRDEQGNRVYYSSAEIDAEIAAAKAEMDRQCSEN